MQLTMLKAKLHQARVTHSELEYEGSCAIDEALLQQVGILPYEQVDIYNLANGERFTTYAIVAESGSRVVSLNGAAAHKGQPGDRVIICAYARFEADELADYQPQVAYLDATNRLRSPAAPVSAATG